MSTTTRQRLGLILAALILLGIIASLCGDGDPEPQESPSQPEPARPTQPAQAQPAQSQPAQADPQTDRETDAAQAQTEPAETTAEHVEPLLAQLTIAAESDSGIDYDRDDYMPRGWLMTERAECSVRERVLIAEAISISQIDRRCRPVDGVWHSWFDGRRLTNPSDLDIDHLVPLAEAHDSGAAAWSAKRKSAFANDLTLAAALTAVSASSNRAKGADDPAEWKPPLREAWCQYARDWIAVKAHWSLTVDQAEVAALRIMLETCPSDYARLAEHPDRRPRVVTTPSTESSDTATPVNTSGGSGTVYSSCDAAQAAGAQRQVGTSGSGRGYPAASVPSARDGDSDGVVCER